MPPGFREWFIRFGEAGYVALYRYYNNAIIYALGGVAAIRRQEILQSRDFVQRRGCPDHPRHRSMMRLRRLCILACFETREPRVGLGCRDV
jgi:hypothetical protein